MNIFLLFLTTIIMIGYYIMYSPSQNLPNIDDETVIELSDLHAMAECVVVTHNDFINCSDDDGFEVPCFERVQEDCFKRYGVMNAEHFCTTDEYHHIEDCGSSSAKYRFWVTYSNSIESEQFANMLTVIESYYKGAHLFGIYNTGGSGEYGYVLTVDTVGSHLMETSVDGLTTSGQLVYVTKQSITPETPEPPEPPLPPEPPIEEEDCDAMCKKQDANYFGKIMEVNCAEPKQCICFSEECLPESDWEVNCSRSVFRQLSLDERNKTLIAMCTTSCDTTPEQCNAQCIKDGYASGMLNLDVDSAEGPCPCYCIPGEDFDDCGPDGEYVLVIDNPDQLESEKIRYHWECVTHEDTECPNGYEIVGPFFGTGRSISKTAQKIGCTYSCFKRGMYRDKKTCKQWCVPNPATRTNRSCSDGTTDICHGDNASIYFGFVTSRTESNPKKQSQMGGITYLFDQATADKHYVPEDIMEKFFKESTNDSSYAQDLRFHCMKCPDGYKEDTYYTVLPYSVICVPDATSKIDSASGNNVNNNDENEDNKDKEKEENTDSEKENNLDNEKDENKDSEKEDGFSSFVGARG